MTAGGTDLANPAVTRWLMPRLGGALLVAMAVLVLASSAGAATTVEAPPKVEDVKYGTASPLQAANIYPSPYAQSPVVVLVHGGGWRFNAYLRYLEPEAKSLQKQGFTVYEINYRQDSKTVTAFPLEPSDVVTATRWAMSTATSYNGDPGKTFMIGGSAGGQLVAMAASQIDTETPHAIAGVVTLSAAGANFLTLKPMIEAEAFPSENFEVSVERALGWHPALGQAFPQAYAERWSPTLRTPPSEDCPQWMLFNSAEELIPVSQAEEMQNSLVADGCSSTLTIVPGTVHAFAYFHEVKPQVFAWIKSIAATL